MRTVGENHSQQDLVKIAVPQESYAYACLQQLTPTFSTRSPVCWYQEPAEATEDLRHRLTSRRA